MKWCIAIALLLAHALPAAAEGDAGALPTAAQGTGQLVWAGEFGYQGLPDSTRWSYDVGGHGWGNQELQYYTRQRAKNLALIDRHSNQVLHPEILEAMLRAATHPYDLGGIAAPQP